MANVGGIVLVVGLIVSVYSGVPAHAITLTEARALALIEEAARYYPCVGFNIENSSDPVYVSGVATDTRAFLSQNGPFPATVAVRGRDQPISVDDLNYQYRRLQRAGLATSQSAGSIILDGRTVELRTYDLSDLGRSMFQVIEQRGSDARDFAFCWGTGQVTEIVDFVPPTASARFVAFTVRWNTVDSEGNRLRALPQALENSLIGPIASHLGGERIARLRLRDGDWEMVR